MLHVTIIFIFIYLFTYFSTFRARRALQKGVVTLNKKKTMQIACNIFKRILEVTGIYDRYNGGGQVVPIITSLRNERMKVLVSVTTRNKHFMKMINTR